MLNHLVLWRAKFGPTPSPTAGSAARYRYEPIDMARMRKHFANRAPSPDRPSPVEPTAGQAL